MKVFAAIVVSLLGIVLCFGVSHYPMLGDSGSPASNHVSAYYIAKSLEQTHVPNVVTSILADYRGFDTMVETSVIFIAAMGILLLLRTSRKSNAPFSENHVDESLIVRASCRIVIPFIQLFALYVVAHGHFSPGGGFQGGVMLAASLILLAMTHGLKFALEKWTERSTIVMTAVGVLIYAGVGLMTLLLGQNFLDYGVLSVILPDTNSVMARSHGIFMVEIGVAITVMSALFSIFIDLSTRGNCDQGL